MRILRIAAVLLIVGCASSSPEIRMVEKALTADPENGPLTYVLAIYRDRGGDVDGAIAALRRLENIVWTHGVNDNDFTVSRTSAAYRAVTDRLNAREPHIVRSTSAFVVPQRDLIPEGIAWDPTTGDFFISSIYRRKVVRVTQRGEVSDFVPEGRDGLVSTLGMKVDNDRRLLWVVSSAAPDMRGYSKDLEGVSSLHIFDLRTGATVATAKIGDVKDPTLLNDLALLPDGSALITDTVRSNVVRYRDGRFENWIDPATLRSPNGIALSDDAKYLFVADFRGVARFNVADKTMIRLPLPAKGDTLSGIDGLSYHRGTLIGLQNSTGRPRVVRAHLDAPHEKVTRLEVLEAGNPLFDEPTTGTVANDGWYFMANPQLRAFDDHRIWPDERLRDVVILRIPL